ncbi:hypothetical protein QVH35_10410 [Candidatus Nitrosotenuis chungbukensis]|nr:hypothetical protein [Candidatus Nitrosotenuis chungbukensis]WKT57717.1 hypothetical protein QVH35_10410 [Candidatus Nitrosotenuis chungbukensis]
MQKVRLASSPTSQLRQAWRGNSIKAGPSRICLGGKKKVQTISFAIKKHKVWVSIDKKVIRSEMLRIIDSCLPLVRNYS